MGADDDDGDGVEGADDDGDGGEVDGNEGDGDEGGDDDGDGDDEGDGDNVHRRNLEYTLRARGRTGSCGEVDGLDGGRPRGLSGVETDGWHICALHQRL